MNMTTAHNTKMPDESPHHPCEHVHSDGRNCPFVAPVGRPFCAKHKRNARRNESCEVCGSEVINITEIGD